MLGDNQAQIIQNIQQAFGHDVMGKILIKELYDHLKHGCTLVES